MSQKPKKTSPRLIAVFSDIHCGSSVGLLPPNFVTKEGQEVGQNVFQRWLWQCWEYGQKFLASVAGNDPYALVLNGDLIEGNHHRTTQIISPDVADHVQAAIDILAPLSLNAAKTYVVRGTECHVGTREMSIADRLGAEIYPETKQRSADELFLAINGLTINFRHHCSATSRTWLESGEFSRMLHNERAEALRNGERPADVVVRAHRHRFGCWDEGHGMAIVTPAWQGLTRHGHKVVPSARCQPGVFILDFRGKGHGEMPAVHRQIYRKPVAAAIPL